MSHLQTLLDEMAWREQLAQSAAAAGEASRKQRERAEIERQKGLRVCRCGMSYDIAHPLCQICHMRAAQQKAGTTSPVDAGVLAQ
jgi:CDGSH-type Zn-finger protein